ncbi:DUF2085 domain-containing protein [Leptolyngbya sp. 7M]|uniref:DUF2085 domain-containing protein n=1 Tax=Leptolyngbya sp. 7M TaxID=2812896 RepID=UPI001B8B6AA8|nr:DUF2085 domain-containing protein [Leptolyngbya sp. 7M]QYO65948.1 DUF2085 domain-containing protein [Leptolyngbya sp. 7M]
MKTLSSSASSNFNVSESAIKRQAKIVWLVALFATLIWLVLIIAPALLRALDLSPGADAIFAFFGSLCHQIPERSFYLSGQQLAVCSRCFGVYFGLFVSLLIYPLWRVIDDIEPLPRKWLLLSVLPMSLDWSLTIFNIWENNHASRFITGMILGGACSIYILPALVEIFRNLSFSRR